MRSARVAGSVDTAATFAEQSYFFTDQNSIDVIQLEKKGVVKREIIVNLFAGTP